MNNPSLLFLLSILSSVLGQDHEYTNDPYLAYRPPFARSLPVQIMLTGVVLTLVAVLFIHLMFTGQYHWPLAPVNYVLQLSGVTTLLISLIATIHVVLSATFAESEKWPYMLSYIAVNVPPLDLDFNTEGWTVAERATWLVMNASTSGLIQITHIQFLTLLYPSRLEGRLIFALLGPLAVVAAVMQLLPISGSTSVNTIASAVRNVCNATLSLLFTVALFIWGLLVNRKQAWRTDGGTAVFGCAALALAIVSTALNFLYIHKEEEFVWLPGLMWAVVLWQSFLGWWWWVGAGSGSGFASEDENREEKLRREAKREERKREAREKRREAKVRARRVWKGVAGAFAGGVGGEAHSTSAQSREGDSSHVRERAPTTRPRNQPSHSHSSQANTNTQSTPPSPRPSTSTSTHSLPSSSSPSSTSATPTLTATSLSAHTYSTLPRLLPGVIHQWYASLRHAHVAAAREQAAERVARIREMERRGGGGGVGGERGRGEGGGRGGMRGGGGGVGLGGGEARGGVGVLGRREQAEVGVGVRAGEEEEKKRKRATSWTTATAVSGDEDGIRSGKTCSHTRRKNPNPRTKNNQLTDLSHDDNDIVGSGNDAKQNLSLPM
ncbi:hypothetical protein B0H34DRAFT_806622 [Crassisporium funariophilum]|nr:hypothetical protein B0H34DRAFT_806622 [Crassisporium funariophilum]